MGTEPTWIVVARDVSSSIHVEGESHLVAAMVVDQATGLVHGASIAPTRREVLSQTLQMALTNPPGPVPAQRPARVLCSPEHVAEVTDELGQLLTDATPEVTGTEPISGAEDIFDSFIGHMSGRRQPGDILPEPEDWRQLVAATHDFYLTTPWQRWSDTDQLDLVVRVDGKATRYVAIVLGQEGIQYGLVLYPGGALADTVRDWQPGQPAPVPPGTLMAYLDPPAEIPGELVAKAVRYGWPADADLVPLWLASDPDGVTEPGRSQAHHLTLAATAVGTHVSRQPTTGTTARTTGRVSLGVGGEHPGEFTVTGPAE